MKQSQQYFSREKKFRQMNWSHCISITNLTKPITQKYYLQEGLLSVWPLCSDYFSSVYFFMRSENAVAAIILFTHKRHRWAKKTDMNR